MYIKHESKRTDGKCKIRKNVVRSIEDEIS